MPRLLMILVLFSGLLLGTTGCKKHNVLATSSLDANKPLVISFDQDLAPCGPNLCWVAIADNTSVLGSAIKLSEGARAILIKDDGSYTIFESGDPPEAEEPEELPENWEDEPIVGYDERKAEAIDKAMGNARKELATGTLADVDGKRILEIAPDLLPAGEFMVYTNGWFGALLDGERIGSPTKIGLVEITR